MPTYEIDKRQPASSQGMTPRRMQWTGAIGVHTCENTPDLILPDGGAEGVTNFIFTRRDAGSYHVIVDSDSVKWLFPPETWETWSVAARDEYGRRHNSYTASMSYAYRASWWGRNPDYEARMIDNGGKVCAEMLLMWSDGNVDQALKACVWRTPREIADGRPGFFEHGSVQADRNDAWSEHPQRDDLRRRHIASTRYWLGSSEGTEDRKVPGNMYTSILKQDGGIEEFAIFGSKPYHRWQTAPNNGWGNWVEFFNYPDARISPTNDPGSFDNITVSMNQDGRLEVAAFHTLYGPFGVFKTVQTGPEKTWTNWFKA